MDSSSTLLAVRDASDASFSPLTYDLLITLLVLILVSSSSALALYLMRRRRQAAKEAGLPFHNDPSKASLSASRSHHRRNASSLTAPVSTTRPLLKSIFSRQEKQATAPGQSSPPAYPLPEIRIHFPEEYDDMGKQQSARIVAVRVGENGVGLEPVEESLPAYQKDSGDRFHSLDMERLGGLQEKEIVA